MSIVVEVKPIEVQKWHKKTGAESFTRPKKIQALVDPTTMKYATGLSKEDIKKLTKDLSTFQKRKDFILVPSFNSENGTYTATQKIKRHQVIMLYKEDINTLLKSHGESILFD